MSPLPFEELQAYLVLLRFALLHCADTVFSTSERLWQPCIEQVYWCHFSNSICCLCVSVLHFGNSHNISNFFIIIIFVTEICDQ